MATTDWIAKRAMRLRVYAGSGARIVRYGPRCGRPVGLNPRG